MSVSSNTRTRSATDASRGEWGQGDSRGAPALFVALDCQRLTEEPLRLWLDDVDEVLVGRGPARTVRREVDGGTRRLSLTLPDAWLSSRHARLRRALGRWVVEDLGSKNGTLVDGEPVERHELADGEWLELGQTFARFRGAVPREPTGETPTAARRLGLVTLLPSLEQAFERMRIVAASGVPVVLAGETGTGKEVVARAVHALSGRKGDFVAVNCGALPKDLVDAELSGHRKGAFSGALEERGGLVRAADGGTLFLDELAELPLPSQASLLRILQEREVRPVGATRALPVDFRLVSATHRALPELVERGAFRADLLGRVAGHELSLPPLRERREDLGLLVRALVERLAPERASRLTLHPRAARALVHHGWPGNVRELERALATALVLASARGGRIELAHLPPAVRSAAAPRADVREQLVALLREHEGNVSAVARSMGKARMQVQRWMKRFELSSDTFRR